MKAVKYIIKPLGIRQWSDGSGLKIYGWASFRFRYMLLRHHRQFSLPLSTWLCSLDQYVATEVATDDRRVLQILIIGIHVGLKMKKV